MGVHISHSACVSCLSMHSLGEACREEVFHSVIKKWYQGLCCQNNVLSKSCTISKPDLLGNMSIMNIIHCSPKGPLRKVARVLSNGGVIISQFMKYPSLGTGEI